MKPTALLLAALTVAAAGPASPAACHAHELRFCLHADPKTFDPLLVEDEASETVRYLTGGVLIRLNRRTQDLEPELAASWQVDRQSRRIRFQLRAGLRFSDGTPLGPEDVVRTMRALMDPALHSPTADSFGAGVALPRAAIAGPREAVIEFPAPVAGLERLFDQVPILPARAPRSAGVTAGPFYVAGYQPGAQVLLQRNPYYWKRDPAGRAYPYLDALHLSIQQNRELEALRFSRGELDLLGDLTPELFEQLKRRNAAAVRDLGPSLDSEMMWFNQVAGAPIALYKKEWFASQAFRRGVSRAINRADLCRVVYHGHAAPAAGPVSAANKFWANARLAPDAFDPAAARRLFEQAGFRLRDGALRDRGGHPVEFSIITNAGNEARRQIGLLIQQDLGAVGIRVNVVTLDFPALIDRITHSFQYEAVVLSLTNLDLDPSGQMNIWLSSAANHEWNPNQKSPATAWEAEIDRLMRAQAGTPDRAVRKRLFDRVQQIVWEQAPSLYLVDKNALVAVSASLEGLEPAVLRPCAWWNIEKLATGPHALARMGK